MTSPDSDSHAPPITYTRTTWADSTTQINADRLNNAETGVTQSYAVLNAHDERLDALEAAPGLVSGINQASKGPTTARPAPKLDLYYYDTTLHKPLWGDGSAWRDYSGVVIGGAGGSNAPQNFQAVTQPSNTILCSWNAVTGATTYKLYESQFPTGVSGASAIPSTSYTFTPPTTATAAVFAEPFDAYPTTTAWAEGSTVGSWFVQFTGGGQVIPVDVSGDRVLQLESQSGITNTGNTATQSSLVTSTITTTGDLTLTARMRTAAQLRSGYSPPGTPNAWEVCWLLWNYTEPTSGVRRFYYIGLKTSGFELGKVDQSIAFPGGQRFLFTDSTPFSVGTFYNVQIQQTGARIQVSVDGVVRADFTDGVGSGGTPAWGTSGETVFTSGAVGLYQEDARAQFASVTATTSTASPVQIVQEKAFEITSTAENSTVNWQAQYTYIQDIGDQRGYTGGIVGFTSATGDMLDIVKNWNTIAPGNILAKYINGLTTCASVGMGSSASSAASSNLGSAFITAWHTASTDPVWQKVQRDYRESVYWGRAYDAAVADGLSPLGIALYYDTSVNHGPGKISSNDGSFDDIRSRTAGTKPVNGGSETTWLNNFLNVRSAVLTAWGDNPSNGRITMFRTFVSGGKFQLITPLTWSIYGDSFTMATDPTPAGVTANRAYDLWVTANVSGTESAASNHASATVPFTGGPPAVSAGADGTVVHGGAFTRTGTVTGTGVTATGWRLIVTPADDNTAAKNLSWGQPLSASDEFEYTGPPDPTKWGVYDGPGHAGNGIRNPARCTVANGKLTIQGMAGSADTGGMASALNQQYGKWEIRMRNYYTNNPTLAGTDPNGYHPVAIVWPSDDVWPQHGEYDFIETDVPGMQSTDGFIHYPSINGSDSQEELPAVACDMRQFHNFAIEWTSAFIKTYIDGVLWDTLSGGGNSTRHNIQDMPLGQLTLQLDAFHASGFTASTMEFEWARIYPLVPVNPNTSLSSTAALSWTAPSTPGTYTLELFATNSAGTATDQITVTVT